MFGRKERPQAIRSDSGAPVVRPMCSCGSSHFTAGGECVSPAHDGVSAWTEPRGAVLACLQCGKRWYQTEHGLREPHADAMPPAWASLDQRKADIERLTKLREASADHTRRRPIEREFRRPPRPA